MLGLREFGKRYCNNIQKPFRLAGQSFWLGIRLRVETGWWYLVRFPEYEYREASEDWVGICYVVLAFIVLFFANFG